MRTMPFYPAREKLQSILGRAPRQFFQSVDRPAEDPNKDGA